MTDKTSDHQAELLRLPPVPRFDADRDGNPFRWIVATAPKVRANVATLVQQHRLANRDSEV